MDEARCSNAGRGDKPGSSGDIPVSPAPCRQLQARSALPKRAAAVSRVLPAAASAAAASAGTSRREGSRMQQSAAPWDNKMSCSGHDGTQASPAAVAAAAAVQTPAMEAGDTAAAERLQALAEEENFFFIESEGDRLLEAEVLCLPLAGGDAEVENVAAGAEGKQQQQQNVHARSRRRPPSAAAAAAQDRSKQPSRRSRAAELIAQQAASWRHLYGDDSMGDAYLLLQQRLQRRLLALGVLCSRPALAGAAAAAAKRRLQNQQAGEDPAQQQRRKKKRRTVTAVLEQGEATAAPVKGEVTAAAGGAADAAARRQKAAGAADAATRADAAAAAASEPRRVAVAEEQTDACEAAGDTEMEEAGCSEEAEEVDNAEEANELVLRTALLRKVVEAGQQNERKAFQGGWVNCLRSRRPPRRARRYFGAAGADVPPAAAAVATLAEARSAALARGLVAAGAAVAAAKFGSQAGRASDVPAASGGAAAAGSTAAGAGGNPCSSAIVRVAAASHAAPAEVPHATAVTQAGKEERNGKKPVTAADSSRSRWETSVSLSPSLAKAKEVLKEHQEETMVVKSVARAAAAGDATNADGIDAASVTCAADTAADTAKAEAERAAAEEGAPCPAVATAEGVTDNVATGDGRGGLSVSAATPVDDTSVCREAANEKKLLDAPVNVEKTENSAAQWPTACSFRGESDTRSTHNDETDGERDANDGAASAGRGESAAGAAAPFNVAAGSAAMPETKGRAACSATTVQKSDCAATAASAGPPAAGDAGAASGDSAAAGDAAAAAGDATAAADAATADVAGGGGTAAAPSSSFLCEGGGRRAEPGGRAKQKQQEEGRDAVDAGGRAQVAVATGGRRKQLSLQLAEELDAHDCFLFTLHRMRKTICYFCGKLACPRSADGRISCPESRCEHCYEKGHRSCSKAEALRSPLFRLVDSRFQLRYHYGFSEEDRLHDQPPRLRQQTAAAFLPPDLQHISCLRCRQRGHFLCGRAPAQEGYPSLSVRMSVSAHDTHAKQNVIPDFVWSLEEAAAYHMRLPRELRRRLEAEASYCSFSSSAAAHGPERKCMPPPPPPLSPPHHSHSGRYSSSSSSYGAAAVMWSQQASFSAFAGVPTSCAAAGSFGGGRIVFPSNLSPHSSFAAAHVAYHAAVDVPAAAAPLPLQHSIAAEEPRHPPLRPRRSVAAAAAPAASGSYMKAGMTMPPYYEDQHRSSTSPRRRAAADTRLLQGQHPWRSEESGRGGAAGNRQTLLLQQQQQREGIDDRWSFRGDIPHPYPCAPAAAEEEASRRRWRSQGGELSDIVHALATEQPLLQTPRPTTTGTPAHRRTSPQQQQHPACDRRVPPAAAAAAERGSSWLREEQRVGGSNSRSNESFPWQQQKNPPTAAPAENKWRGGNPCLSEAAPPSPTWWHGDGGSSSSTQAHVPRPVLLRPAAADSRRGGGRGRSTLDNPAAAAQQQQHQQDWRDNSPLRHRFVESHAGAQPSFSVPTPLRTAALHASSVSRVCSGHQRQASPATTHARAVGSSGYYVREAAAGSPLHYRSSPSDAADGGLRHSLETHVNHPSGGWRRVQLSPDPDRNTPPEAFPYYAAAPHHQRRSHHR